MKAYSQDLRQRVLHIIDAGASQATVAEMFSVSVATIKRYLKRRREVGHVLPKAIPGRPAVKGTVLRAHLRAQLEAHPDATREDHCRLFQQAHGITVSPASISRARAVLGWTRKKKTIRASEQDDVARAAWREQAKQLPTQDVVIVDETGTQINMTPLYAYAPRGERAVGKVPRNYGANLTLIASLSLTGFGEAMLLDGSADAAAFEIYIEQILAPSLRAFPNRDFGQSLDSLVTPREAGHRRKILPDALPGPRIRLISPPLSEPFPN